MSQAPAYEPSGVPVGEDLTPSINPWRDTSPPSASVSWSTGWYMRKRHVAAGPTGHRALCSPYTGVYPNGYDRSSRPCRAVPPADSPEVMALPACGLCLRKLPDGASDGAS